MGPDPREYGPPKTLYNRWKRWDDKGIFARMMEGLASEAAVPKTVMIDVEPVARHWSENHWRGYLKAHRTARSLRSKRGGGDQRGRLIGRTKGGMNTKLHTVSDADGRPIRCFMTAGQVSGYTGAVALLGSLPLADWILADRRYDADWFRDALKDKGINRTVRKRDIAGHGLPPRGPLHVPRGAEQCPCATIWATC